MKKCNLCNAEFPTLEELKAHYEPAHGGLPKVIDLAKVKRDIETLWPRFENLWPKRKEN